jgi:Zn-dependent hydrolases, including glyoxylases
MHRYILAIFCLAAPGAATIAETPKLHRATIAAAPVSENAYVVTGGISNAGFVIGATGVIAIDAQMNAEDAKLMQSEIAKRTRKPVTTIILTHSDVDHLYGLPAWPKGLRILAQENLTPQLQTLVANPDSRMPPPQGLASYFPTETVRHSKTLVIDGVQVVLTHLRAGHTNGDLVIYFPVERVAYVGDLLTFGDLNNPSAGLFPVIHLDKHGSSAGWLDVMKAVLALEADVFIGGHGPARKTREQIEEAVAATERRRTEVKRLFDQGMELAQIKAELNDPAPVAPLFFPTFVETVYRELLRE